MSLLKFFTKDKENNPIPDGPQFDKTRELLDKSPTPSKRGSYKNYSPKQRFDIGKYAAENGNSRAVAKFSPLFEKKLSESTVRGFKTHYLKETKSAKRKLIDSESCSSDCEISELVLRKRGRKLLLGEELDNKVQLLITAIRDSGGVINTAIVRAAATGLVISHDRTMLLENGGGVELTKTWAKTVLNRMGMVKRKGTTSKKIIVVENFEQEKSKYLKNIQNKMTMKNIPPELVINWDQTGLHIVPVGQWTMEVEGSKRVEITGIDDKRQITATFAGTLSGHFLPPQLIYGGKTDLCHPKYKFPEPYDITHSENHWANEDTMIRYIKNINRPYVDNIKDELDLPLAQKALVIFDCFRGQITEKFLSTLENNHLVYVTVPPNCTDRLQPMDLSVNKCAKDFLKKEFQTWYANEVADKVGRQLENITSVKVDLSLTNMKPLGAKWIVKLCDHLSTKPDIIRNGFSAAGILG